MVCSLEKSTQIDIESFILLDLQPIWTGNGKSRLTTQMWLIGKLCRVYGRCSVHDLSQGHQLLDPRLRLVLAYSLYYVFMIYFGFPTIIFLYAYILVTEIFGKCIGRVTGSDEENI